jgi:hypothetical protein
VYGWKVTLGGARTAGGRSMVASPLFGLAPA